MVVAQTSACRTSRPDTFSSAATPPVTSEKWCRDVKMITSINTVSLHHPRSARLSAGNTSRRKLRVVRRSVAQHSDSASTAALPTQLRLAGWKQRHAASGSTSPGTPAQPSSQAQLQPPPITRSAPRTWHGGRGDERRASCPAPPR